MATFDPNWASAIASLESAGSGGYGAVGPMTRSGNRAYGRYQVMDFNIPNWTRKYVGREMTPDEFLADPRAQDLVFQGEFGSYVNQYGSPEEAASVWFTGRPMSQGAGASDILGTTGAQYVDRFNAALSDPNVIARGIGNDALVAIGKAPTQRTEAPMGLLDMGQPQGQPQPQQGGFWDRFAGGILADPDRRARLAMALEGMTLNPNQGVIQAAQSGIEERRTQGQANRTIEYLRSQPGGEQFIPLVEVAGAGGALQAYLEAAKKPAFTNEQLGQAGALRDDLNRELGDFGVVRSGYENISTFYNTPNAVSDYALAVAFAKILDPGSVAREGEVAAVQNAGAKVPALGQALKNAITGEGALTDEVRYQIAQLASQIYANKAAGAEETIGRYRSAAGMAGLPFDFIYMGGEIPAAIAPTPPASAGMTQSAIDAGVTPEQWTMMTPQQRAAFP